MKITVKHYLNKRLKPVTSLEKGQEINRYPVYLQVIAGGRQAQFKSRLELFFIFNAGKFSKVAKSNLDLSRLSENEFKSVLTNSKYNKAIEAELQFIQNLIKELGILRKPEINLSGIAKVRDLLLQDMSNSFNKYETIVTEGILNEMLLDFPGMKNAIYRWSMFDVEFFSFVEEFIIDFSRITGRDVREVLRMVKRFSESKKLYQNFLWKNYDVIDIPIYFFMNRNFKIQWYEFLREKYPEHRRFCILQYKLLMNIVNNLKYDWLSENN